MQIRFSELSLSAEMQKSIVDMGFEEASPIQSESIPYILEGRDVIGQAQTGTGKTVAFGIPVCERVDPTQKTVQAIILCPTRELAIQVSEEFGKLLKHKRGVKFLPVYGGQPIDRQIRALSTGVHIVIGTPGRVIDHIQRRTLNLANVKMVVLDEADEMLDMGFREDIESILTNVPSERQTVFFSATMSKSILALTKAFQTDPQFVKVVPKEMAVPLIDQHYIELKERDKCEVLTRLIDVYNPKLSLVFCNTKRVVDELVTHLSDRGYFAGCLHGDLKQTERDRVMSKFRKCEIDILVATDVAARGLDVDDIEAVFNYDMPQDEEYYVHRIGRTGRAGRSGKSFTFVAGRDSYKLGDIRRFTKSTIKRHDIPTLSDVEETKIAAIVEKIKGQIEEGHLTKYVHILEKLSEDYTSLDIAAGLLKMTLGTTDGKDLANKQDAFSDTGAEPGMVRFFINVGRNHQVSPRDIIQVITSSIGLPGNKVGAISIFRDFTFVSVPKDSAMDFMSVMKNQRIRGNKINIEPARQKTI